MSNTYISVSLRFVSTITDTVSCTLVSGGYTLTVFFLNHSAVSDFEFVEEALFKIVE
jgi:hypothetical protein